MRDASTSCVVVMLVMVVGGGEGLVMMVTYEAIIRGLVRDTSTSCVVVMLLTVVGGGERLVMMTVTYEAIVRGLVRDASTSAHCRRCFFSYCCARLVVLPIGLLSATPKCSYYLSTSQSATVAVAHMAMRGCTTVIQVHSP